MILVDTNVLMYTAGADHPHEAPSIAFLKLAADGRVEACLDAEVLQEILHRYRLARQIVPRVLPVEAEAVDRARELMERAPHLRARDAVHGAIALSLGGEICSYDADLDAIPGLKRRQPDECPRH
ncbi:MAG: type II toxin-antitoxin system VapC family toxin [Candidatus Eremiobacterota bacterium]